MAAVLACQPRILALDEPWANLDARARKAVTRILAEFTGTLLIASHDLASASPICDRLVIMHEGCLVADGGMQDLMADVDRLEAHGLI